MSVIIETKFIVKISESSIELTRQEAEELFSLLSVELMKVKQPTQNASTMLFGSDFQYQSDPVFAK